MFDASYLTLGTPHTGHARDAFNGLHWPARFGIVYVLGQTYFAVSTLPPARAHELSATVASINVIPPIEARAS